MLDAFIIPAINLLNYSLITHIAEQKNTHPQTNNETAMSLDIDIPWLEDNMGNSTSKEPCGLFSTNERPGESSPAPIPLKKRHVAAHVFAEHCFCEITESHSYIADENTTARFIFPLPPRSAVFK